MIYIVNQIMFLEWYYYCSAIVLFILALYILLVINSFVFMFIFSIKLKRASHSINLILYQKADCLLRISKHMKTLVDNNQIIKDFVATTDINNYKVFDVKNFDHINKKENEIFKEIKLIYVNNKNIPDKEKVIALIKSYDDLCKNYAKQTQYYNTYVVGYNYWRNLFTTKWIKLLLKKKEKDLIV